MDVPFGEFLRLMAICLITLRLGNQATPVLVDAITRDCETHRVVLPGIKRILALVGSVRRLANAALLLVVQFALAPRHIME